MSADVMPSNHADLIERLRDPGAYPHPAAAIEVIETHISWVVLAGEFVYKIKKPLALGFLDFRDLPSRKFFCDEEIRLNRPWAPTIYLDVVKITSSGGQLRIGGDGEAVEYAVRMHRFDQSMRLDVQLADGKLTAADMQELGASIAARHLAAEKVPCGQRARILELTETLMWDNLAALEGSITSVLLGELSDRTRQALAHLRSFIGERFDQGYFRDCHGDLHLGNLVRLPDGIVTFDCIEFSSDLRHIDVMCDVAFLVMDLESKGRDDLAAHFLNRYLERTGDYGSMRLFDLYFVYRCLVRAKVAAIRAGERENAEDRRHDLDEARRYCDMARQQTRQRKPLLVVMHGYSGSGKTRLSGSLMADLPAIRIRSDLERKRMFGIAELDRSGAAVAQGPYAAGASGDVYATLFELAATVLGAAHNVILDATFLRREYRRKAAELADGLGARFMIVEVTAPRAELERRIGSRECAGLDASEATGEVLAYQLRTAEPLTQVERERAITVDSRDAAALDGLGARLQGSH